ncbi:cupin domain-containing protein [bacterium]|nr:MAG: cupin domain-containing protein [bacterium]
MLTPYILQPDEGLPEFGSGVKASKNSTGGNLSFMVSKTTGGAPMHVHEREDEYFFVLAGRLTVTIGEEKSEVGEGGFVFMPRGVPHDWDVIGEEATVILMTVPAMLEEFLHEYHAAFADPDRRDRVATDFGIRFL